MNRITKSVTKEKNRDKSRAVTVSPHPPPLFVILREDVVTSRSCVLFIHFFIPLSSVLGLLGCFRKGEICYCFNLVGPSCGRLSSKFFPTLPSTVTYICFKSFFLLFLAEFYKYFFLSNCSLKKENTRFFALLK